MAKRLFTADKRAEKILSHFRDNNVNISAFISDAIVDEILPVYSQLRIEALYLLDFVTDGAKEWHGNKLILATGEDEVDYCIRQTLGRGVSWLKRNHHIKNCDVLRELIEYYHESSWDGGISLDEVNDNVKADIERIQEKLKNIDPEYNGFHSGLGSLARDILDHWSQLWNDVDAYNLFISAILCEKTIRKIEPFVAIRMMQSMETQFIVEAIGERSR